jgi:hypothetical protein
MPSLGRKAARLPRSTRYRWACRWCGAYDTEHVFECPGHPVNKRRKELGLKPLPCRS